MVGAFHSAEIVKTAEGRQYHIGLKPVDVAPFILMCGDTERIGKIAKYFDEKREPVSSREYTTITGKYKGVPISAMATGIGCDNTEIAVVELSQLLKNITIIRVGSSGAIKRDIQLGELVISTGAVRLESTSTYFVMEGYPALAHYEVVLALLESAGRCGRRFHLGLTASAAGFYGAQGRTTPYFKPRFPDIHKELSQMNVSNLEMEASTLFTLATLAGFRAGAVCSVYAQRTENCFISPETKEASELDCIKVALGAVEVLARMDGKKGKGQYWLPSMGV